MAINTIQKPNLSKITQEFVSALEAKGGPPLYTLSPREARKVLIEAQSGPIKKPAVDMTDMELPVGPTGKVPIRIVKPQGADDGLPCIFLHAWRWLGHGQQRHA